MVQAAKSSSSSSNKGNWGMGFLLVFFHHNPESENEDRPPPPTPPSQPYKRRRSFSLSSPLKSSNNALLSRTQSTLSICALFVFSTLLFFTVSSFEPSSVVHHRGNRRVLHQIPQNAHSIFSVSRFSGSELAGNFTRNASPALQGMGALYRRGSKAMTDLVVGHVAEGATEREVISFLRLIHHSGLLSRSDLVLIFDSPASARRLDPVVKLESESFLRLVNLYKLNVSVPGHVSVSGLTRYLRPVGVDDKEAMWGKRRNSSNSEVLTRASYGSMVGFYASELDPEDSLSGFLNHLPMGLRRWACYPMLLGRVRRNFKHTMLVDVRNSLVLSDPFSLVSNRTTESVLIWPESETELPRSHGRKNSASSDSHLNSGVIIGGTRGIRRFANAAVTEIVRAVIDHKGKTKARTVTESGLVKKLVHSGYLFKSINLITRTESIPDASSLAGFNSLDSGGSGFLAFADYFPMVQRGHGGSVIIDIDSLIKKEICSSHGLYSSVYRDCLAPQ